MLYYIICYIIWHDIILYYNCYICYCLYRWHRARDCSWQGCGRWSRFEADRQCLDCSAHSEALDPHWPQRGVHHSQHWGWLAVVDRWSIQVHLPPRQGSKRKWQQGQPMMQPVALQPESLQEPVDCLCTSIGVQLVPVSWQHACKHVVRAEVNAALILPGSFHTWKNFCMSRIDVLDYNSTICNPMCVHMCGYCLDNYVHAAPWLRCSESLQYMRSIKHVNVSAWQSTVAAQHTACCAACCVSQYVLMLWQALICVAGVTHVSALLCQSQAELRLPRARKEVPPSVRLWPACQNRKCVWGSKEWFRGQVEAKGLWWCSPQWAVCLCWGCQGKGNCSICCCSLKNVHACITTLSRYAHWLCYTTAVTLLMLLKLPDAAMLCTTCRITWGAVIRSTWGAVIRITWGTVMIEQHHASWHLCCRGVLPMLLARFLLGVPKP